MHIYCCDLHCDPCVVVTLCFGAQLRLCLAKHIFEVSGADMCLARHNRRCAPEHRGDRDVPECICGGGLTENGERAVGQWAACRLEAEGGRSSGQVKSH